MTDTISPESTPSYLSLTDVLYRMDALTGYDKHDVVRRVLEQLPESDDHKHVVSRNYAKQIINRYIRHVHKARYDRDARTEEERNRIVEIVGRRTATRYKTEDIDTCLASDYVRNILHNRYNDRVEELDGKLVPLVAMDAMRAEKLRPLVRDRLTPKHQEDFTRDPETFLAGVKSIPTPVLTQYLRAIMTELKTRTGRSDQ